MNTRVPPYAAKQSTSQKCVRPLNAALRRCERTACQQAHFHRLAVGGPYYICVGV